MLDIDLQKDYARLAYEDRQKDRWLKVCDAKRKFHQRRCVFYSDGICTELKEKCASQCYDRRLYRFEGEGSDERLVRL